MLKLVLPKGSLEKATLDLFDAAETVARARPLVGERLAIVTNGGGMGVLAVDALEAGGVERRVAPA